MDAVEVDVLVAGLVDELGVVGGDVEDLGGQFHLRLNHPLKHGIGLALGVGIEAPDTAEVPVEDVGVEVLFAGILVRDVGTVVVVGVVGKVIDAV